MNTEQSVISECSDGGMNKMLKGLYGDMVMSIWGRSNQKMYSEKVTFEE